MVASFPKHKIEFILHLEADEAIGAWKNDQEKGFQEKEYEAWRKELDDLGFFFI